jgi:uncharacterized protein YfaS (alpha-2-macroglobulin family)
MNQALSGKSRSRSSFIMKSLFTLVALSAIAFVHALAGPSAAVSGEQPPAPDSEYAALRQRAEKAYAEHSYAIARDIYQQAAALSLSAAQKRWVDFRLADTAWRAQAGSPTADSTVYDKSSRALEDLIRSITRVEDRDLVWAEANESLGDFAWERQDMQDWGRAWPYYSNALDYWAGSADIEVARPRYLHIVWTMSEPHWMHRGYWDYWAHVPLPILDNALKIAQTDDDRARAQYLIAMNIVRQGGDWPAQMRLEKILQGALAAGKKAEWHDDILYAYAEWLSNTGRPVVLEDGQMSRKRDFVKALELLKQLVSEYREGQTPFWGNAQAMIKDITTPVVSVGVSNFFLPNSQIQFSLAWRNVKAVNLALWKVNLTDSIKFRSGTQEGLDRWLNAIDISGSEKVKAWTKETGDSGEYEPGQSMEKLEEPLAPGAYVLEASGEGGARARDLILVSDSAVALKTAGNQVLAWAVNAVNSAPIPNANVRIWKAVWRDNNKWVIADARKATGDDGLAVFNEKDFAGLPAEPGQYFVAIESDQRQAMAQSHANSANPTSDGWRIYAFTDRPAYRPTEKVEWKIIARQQQRDGWSTPAGTTLLYEIADPRGTKMSEGTLTLNDFGSAWASVETTSQLPLGEYTINFWRDKGNQNHVGGATLFRLEEYKLPEFEVAVSTPLENGKRKAYLLGEYVEATIQADYYFGGPVANATVEVVVKQNPYYRWWTWPREYPWCYEQENPYRYWYGGDGQVIKQETLKTDATGKATITFETPANQGQDLHYVIEARVTDASRREITASDNVRVTQHRYYVSARPEHNILRPNDEADINFMAVDANDQPWTTEGNVRVTREVWTEVWIDSSGNEVSGAALRDLRAPGMIFPPPPPRPDLPGWRLKFNGYKSEEILKTKVQLDQEGKATFTFTPASEGYYRIAWNSPDPGTSPVYTETFVWVATDKSTDVNYRHGGLQIIVDKDTVRSGADVPVMIATPTANRFVLFSVEGFDLYSCQVVHVTGDVKLLNVPIKSSYVPNVWFSAIMAHDGQMFADSKEVIVPPVDEYLNIEVAADRSQYQPGEEGTFTIKATDHDGKPARAEVAIAVVDESVTYIQQDYAGDPRPFFFQQRQWNIVQGGSTFNQKSFVRLVKGKEDQIIDEKQAMAENELLKQVDGLEFSFQSARGDTARRELAEGGGFGGGGARGRMESRMSGTAGMPAPASAAPMDASAAGAEGLMSKAGKAPGGALFGEPGDDPARLGEEPAVQVRSDFRSTLLWNPSVMTDEAGMARVNLTFADSLTTWKTTARAAATGAQFGIGNASVRTRMPLIARLQAPRFFLVGDTVTISGVINNNTEQVMSVRPEVKIEGLNLLGRIIDGQPSQSNPPIDIAANSEARVDWQVQVDSLPPQGQAKIILTARSDKHADAMEKTYTVHEHGMQRFVASSGKVRGDDVTVVLNIPAARKPESTTLNVQITSSMAVTMLDALPYLIDYPYGCTEQTMSRFLPAVITAKTLSDLGVKPETIMGKVFGGIEQQFVDKTHPQGKGDLKQLDQITQASLDRLYDFQHGDGGWGWWKEGPSDHFMTAYVVWGFALAKEAGLDVRQDALDRGANFLNVKLVEQESAPDMQTWMLHALSKYRQISKQKPHEFEAKAMTTIFAKRDRLNAYTRALAALSAHQMGDAEKARILIDNLRNGVKKDDRPDASVIVGGAQNANQSVLGTAHWGEGRVGWWRWSDGGVEATAFALRAILAIDPGSDLVEPVTNWLIKNRRGAQWSNTRDTAIVVLALNDYLRASGELAPEMEYELLVNGTSIATKKLSAADALTAPSLFAIDQKLIRDGDNQIRIVRKAGTGPVYYSADSQFYSLEEPIPPSGNEIFVRREYYKLVPTPTLLKGVVYDRKPLGDGESVASGERVEVVLTIETKNNYEYLVFEDMKPAGLEAVAVRSGEPLYSREMKKGVVDLTFGDGNRSEQDVRNEQRISGHEDFTGRQEWVYQELRDRKVAMFVSRLPEGVWELRYDMRAETPGRFHALPVVGHAMYVPEIRCNGREVRISVTE